MDKNQNKYKEMNDFNLFAYLIKKKRREESQRILEHVSGCIVLGLQQWPRYTYNLLNNVFGAVEDISKSPGASKLARSLFQSLPQQIPKEVVLFPKPGHDFLTDGSNFYKFENVQGEFHEIHKAFGTQSHPHLNIGLHKF